MEDDSTQTSPPQGEVEEVCVGTSSPSLNDRDPFDFDRGTGQRVLVFWIFKKINFFN